MKSYYLLSIKSAPRVHIIIVGPSVVDVYSNNLRRMVGYRSILIWSFNFNIWLDVILSIQYYLIPVILDTTYLYNATVIVYYSTVLQKSYATIGAPNCPVMRNIWYVTLPLSLLTDLAWMKVNRLFDKHSTTRTYSNKVETFQNMLDSFYQMHWVHRLAWLSLIIAKILYCRSTAWG